MYNKLGMPDDWIGGNHSYRVCDGYTVAMTIHEIEKYFTQELTTLVYPAKSYAVALIYSTMLEDYFGVDRMESLADPNLLYRNDRFFKPYDDTTKNIYDAVIPQFPPFDAQNIQVRTTIESFKREFYLNPNPYFNNTDLA